MLALFLLPGMMCDLFMDTALHLGADGFVRQSKALAARQDQTETLCNVTQPTLETPEKTNAALAHWLEI